MTCTCQTIRRQLADELERLPEAARVAKAYETCEATGGWLIPPNVCGNWGSHWAEIDLLEVSATGDNEAEAVANWIRAVRRMDAAAEMAA